MEKDYKRTLPNIAMKKRVKKLLKLAKKVVGREVYGKLNEVKKVEDAEKTIEHAIITKLKNDFHDMDLQIEKMEEEKRDVFFARNKLLLVPGKIMHLQAGFEEEELKKVSQLLKVVRSEVKNV